MPKPLWTDQDEPVPIRPLTFKERFALFAEAMWLGILVPLLSLALVTWLAALAAAVASLRRHLGARSDSFGLLWADFLTAVRGAWLPTLVVDALLVLALFNSRLAQLGLVPGGPVLMWLTVAAALLVAAYINKGQLPKPGKINERLFEEPKQTLIDEPPFTFSYEGQNYTIEPVADYEISGLVVTHNDISAFDDIYHTSKSVDIKDLCLVWGANIESGVYRKLEFWSEPWSCNVRTNDLELFKQFRNNALSNTHLLVENRAAASVIRDIHIGDQVTLQGKLINYYPAGSSNMRRSSSITREDEGNGACEVMLVQSARVLEQATPFWYGILPWMKRLIVLLVLLKLVFAAGGAYAEYYR